MTKDEHIERLASWLENWLLPKLSGNEAFVLRKQIAEAREAAQQQRTESEHTGKCYRHHLRFEPNKSFENMCPACWWEREAKSPTNSPEAERDVNVRIQNVGGGSFRLMDE